MNYLKEVFNMTDIRYEKNDKVYHVKKKRLSVKKWTMFLVLPSLIFIIFSVFCITNSISLKGTEDQISYSENGNIDYKVYLKDNNYYEEKFLGKDMQYIASLINTINVDFNYQLHATENMDFDYKYKILGTLKITDKTDKTKVLYTKDYILKDETKESLNANNFRIDADVDIDYDKYNSYANAFRRDYALTSNAELVLKMEIDVDGKYKDLEDKIKKDNNLEISIPLSEQTLEIAMDASKINQSDVLSNQKGTSVTNVILLIAGIILCSIGLIGFGIAIYLYLERYSNDPYEKALHKILKNYDTYIIKAKSDFRESEEPIRVASFEELIDAQQMEKTPILFYEVEPGKKAYFVLNGTKSTYRFTLTKAYQIKLMQKNKKGEF